MSLITALLTFALLHTSVQGSSIKLGCLSAAPTGVSLATGGQTLEACRSVCATSASPYSYFSKSSSSCGCSSTAAPNTLYVDALDRDANCGDATVWYSGIIANSTSNSTTTCPSLGPTSSADLPGYVYLSTLPDPLACYSACGAAGLNVSLIQPGLGGYSCACASKIEGATYAEVCNSQSWYAVQKASAAVTTPKEPKKCKRKQRRSTGGKQ